MCAGAHACKCTWDSFLRSCPLFLETGSLTDLEFAGYSTLAGH